MSQSHHSRRNFLKSAALLPLGATAISLGGTALALLDFCAKNDFDAIGPTA